MCEHKELVSVREMNRDRNEVIDKIFYCCVDCNEIFEFDVRGVPQEFLYYESKATYGGLSFIPSTYEPMSEEHKAELYKIIRGHAKITKDWLEREKSKNNESKN